jgi:hypothetical protein
MTPAEQERVKHLEQKASMQALAIANLGMWRITDDLSKFPHELRKEIYDRNQSVLFGSSMTKGTIKYHYIPKDYTVNGVPLLINWSCAYDGGCDLEGKQVVSWHELEKIFTENKFK